jgi:hypothetical protein
LQQAVGCSTPRQFYISPKQPLAQIKTHKYSETGKA